MRDDGHSTGTVVVSFLLGGVIGAGVALLFAPRSGKETRQRIRELAEDVKDKADDLMGEVKGRVAKTIESGKEFVAEKRSILAEAIEAGKEAYHKEKEKHEHTK
ncbi:MAG: YtxH domain-containing protein [Nitrospirae bacterium]|nr:YtxH domain-containing protein [Nitrospirota bacterium]